MVEAGGIPLGSSVRILSANLWNGGADPEAFARLATDLAADVVAVQELAPAQAEVLSSVFPHGRLEPRTDFDGGGLVLRHPAEVTRLQLGGRPGFRAALRPGAWPELAAPLEVIGLHVYAPHASFGLGLWRRQPQMRDLTRHLASAPDATRVLVGDLNSTPLWPAYRSLRSHMEDAARIVAERRGERPARTWGPWHGAPRLLRIDHGFVRGAEPEAFRVVDVQGSDHCAVVLDVTVPAAD